MNFSWKGRSAHRRGRAGSRARRGLTPMLLSLESRELLTAGPLGVNLAGSLGYVDLIKEASGWVSNSTDPNTPPLTFDANGWPLADARVTVLDERVNQPYNGPDPNAATPDIGGTYHLSFQGNATITGDYFQIFQVQNQSYNAATNTTTADLVVAHYSPPYFILSFHNTSDPASSTGKGVANVKLIQPGYAADTTQLFTTSMINALQPFGTVRYLNTDGVNNYGGPTTANQYQGYSTANFTVGAGPHTIGFVGLNATGDATAFLDNVQVVSNGVQVIGQPTTTPVGDPSFEAVPLGAGNYAFQPGGTPWNFQNSAGISANNSPYTSNNPAAPDGQQVAFLQNTAQISQPVTFAAGSYHINFQAMQRSYYKSQTFEVTVDGTVVGTYTPPASALTQLDWSQRKLPTAWSQTVGPGAPGEAWEYMIALANATNTDLSINIPNSASDSYVAQLANLIKNGDTIDGVTYAGLNPNLKVDVEYSNEVWGGIYNNFLYTFYAAINEVNVAGGSTTLNDDGNTNPYEWAQRYYLERTMQITNIFRSVLGADPTYARVRPILGAQEGNFGYFTDLLPWFETTYGPPSEYFYGIGAANYNGPTDFSSVDNLLASLTAQLPADYLLAERFTTVANYYGLHNVAYEGADGTAGATTDAGGQVSLAAARDPRMESIVNQYYQNWYAAGGELADTYDGPFGAYTPGNQDAIAEQSQTMDPTASPKYRGFVDLSNAAATAVTAGTAVTASAPTTLPVSADTLGNSFAAPGAGSINYWLLNVAAAGNYNLVVQSGAGTTTGRVTVTLGDQAPVGTYNVAPSSTVSIGTLALHAGLNTVGIATLAGFNVTALSLATALRPTFADSGFEAGKLPSGINSYVYQPQGSAWTFSAPSGVAANGSVLTYQNPNAPAGVQVGFVQQQGSISQPISVATAGNYQLSFNAALRATYSGQSLKVVVDGVTVDTLPVTSVTYQTLTTRSFALTAGPHTLALQGTATADGTAFVDALALTSGSLSVPLADAGFEAEQMPDSYSSYIYQPQGAAWSYAGSSGLTGNGTAFTAANAVAPQGAQVAFLQNQGSISQQVANWSAGSYTIAFQLSQRANYGTSQMVQVVVDNTVVGTFAATGPGYSRKVTAAFAVAAGSHQVTIRGLNASGDATAFVDDFQITPQ